MALCFNHSRVLQPISFVYLFIVLTHAASLLSHNEECVALFQFKQNILRQDYVSFNVSRGRFQRFDSWRNITNNGSNCCLWDGVVCSNEGHVIELDLSKSFLDGPINSNNTLFNLVHLQRLNLSMNNFLESQIPSGIGRLKQLRSLDLSYSRFSGQIPNEISHLMHLSYLDLSWNSIKSTRLDYLLQNFTKLEELHLSGVEIGSSVPRILANFSSLRFVYLDHCSLQDEFPSTIFHLSELKYITLEYNLNLTGTIPEFHNKSVLEYLDLRTTGFSGIIPNSISKLNRLTFLALGGCFFSGRIPGSLSNMTQLVHLGLGDNEFTGLVPSLESLTKLIVLDLSDSNFENGSIPYWLSKITRLNKLFLNRMDISDQIPPYFGNITRLVIVSMAHNYIVGRIPSSFMNLTQLTYLDLQHNQMQGPISSSFSNLKSLEFLNLLSNNFSGRVDLNTFVGLKKLDTLYLSSNKISVVETNNYTDNTLLELTSLGLSSCNLKEFPAILRSQKKMTRLFLKDNKIEGLVPEWFLNSSQETLLMIDLSHNFITGFQHHPLFLPWFRLELFEISNNMLQGPMSIPSPTAIVYDVSNNNLTGEMSSLICEVKILRVLDLSSNIMTGTLPSCLGKSSNSLFVLNLKQNKFHGTMMNEFKHGSRLKRIELSENQFIGELPKSLTNCSDLEVLSLGDNSFEDLFPFWLGSLAELQVLSLRSNKLHGEVQGPRTNKSHFSKLRIIDLSNNDFSGQLPETYFQNWNAMKSVYVGNLLSINSDLFFNGVTQRYAYTMTLTNKGVKRDYEKISKLFTVIDLSCNSFEGQIPQALQDLQGIQSLNLSNNHLTGHVLPSLGSLKNLESLDLSQNELSGDIPQQLSQLGFLAIFNVSFNHLGGRIPQGNQFNTFDNSSYIGNPGLCGEPLSKECQNSKSSTLPPTSNMYVSLLPSTITDWMVIFSGVLSGFVTGIVFGKSRSSRYSYWFIERFGMKKDRWVRPLRNTKRK